MAPRPAMYRGDRRRKEEARKAKQEAKRQRRLERKESGVSGPEIEEVPAQQADAPTEYVWFSPSKNRTLTTRTAAQPVVAGIDDWVLLTEPPKPPKPPA